MAQYFPDAEERRRVSMALSVRYETAAKFAEFRREVWNMLVILFHMPASRKIARDRNGLAPLNCDAKANAGIKGSR
jgi:hypothetical protein